MKIVFLSDATSEMLIKKKLFETSKPIKYSYLLSTSEIFLVCVAQFSPIIVHLSTRDAMRLEKHTIIQDYL